MKSKVLMVGSSLEDMGGIVTVIRNIEQSNISEEYKLIRVETYITGSVLARLKIFISGLFKYLYQILFNRPNIVHIHMSNNGSFYRKSILVLMGKSLGLPIIIHIHAASFEDFYNANFFQKKYCYLILNSVDLLIVLSQEWKKYFSKIVPKKKIEVLYNGVFKMEEEIKRTNLMPACLFLGRLGKRKGTYDLLISIKKLKEKGIKSKFILAGDGEIDEVKTKIREYEIESFVEILGWINSDQKEELLKKVDLLVLPSYNEGLPMAILEGMNFSLPIISTYVGGIPEVINNGENGYLIKPGDIEALTNSLEILINNEKTRSEMGIRNKKLIQNNFDINMIMVDLSNIYVGLVKGN